MSQTELLTLEAPAKLRLVRKRRSKTPPVVSLTPLQQFFCSVAGDLIANGGHSIETLNLIMAIGGHYYRRRFGDNDLGEHIGRRMDEWKRGLEEARPANSDEDADTQRGQTASERIRCNYQSTLRSEFESFLCDASAEEQRLLHEVLNTWQSRTHSAEYCDSEIVLAQAFMLEIGEEPTYLALPADDAHKEPIHAFIDLVRSSCEAELQFLDVLLKEWWRCRRDRVEGPALAAAAMNAVSSELVKTA